VTALKQLLFLALLLAPGAAYAQQVAPSDGNCPRYTSRQGSQCVASGDHQVVYTGDTRSACPLGWTKSRNYCVK
jgi:hypothetical protein